MGNDDNLNIEGSLDDVLRASASNTNMVGQKLDFQHFGKRYFVEITNDRDVIVTNVDTNEKISVSAGQTINNKEQLIKKGKNIVDTSLES